MIIPRVKDRYEPSAVGKVYVEFASEKEAQLAKMGLNGKSYDGRTLMTEYYNPKKFADKIFT